MQQHAIAFEGEAAEGEHCIIIKLQYEFHESKCAFCNTEYNKCQEGPGRWDVLMTGKMCKEAKHPTDFLVCSDCRLYSKAVECIVQNGLCQNPRIFLQNAGIDDLYLVDCYYGYNY
jgi:hypothetical protein